MDLKTGLIAGILLASPVAALAQPYGDPNFAGSYYDIPDRGPPAASYEPPPSYAPPPQGYAPQGYPPQSYPPQAYAPEPPPPVYAAPMGPREWRRLQRMRRLQWLCANGYGCRGPGWR